LQLKNIIIIVFDQHKHIVAELCVICDSHRKTNLFNNVGDQVPFAVTFESADYIPCD